MQVGNNRNDHFRYFLGVHVCLNRGVRLIQVSLYLTEKQNNYLESGHLWEVVAYVRWLLCESWLYVIINVIIFIV